MWVDMKGLPWGQKGTGGRGASGKQLGGCVLVILLRSGDALETAELREGDAQGPPGALHLHLDHQVSAVLKDEHPEPGGAGGVPLEGKSNQGKKMTLYHNMPHVNLALHLSLLTPS